MKAHRSIRTLSVLASAALILGAVVAGPADAKKKKKPKPPPPPPACATVTPVEPQSGSEQTAEALEAPMVTVTDAATAEKPHVFEYSHGAAIYDEHIQEDTVFFNVQVDSATPDALLFVRLEWAEGPGSDMDLYLYDASTGEQVESSGSPNLPVPVGPLPTGQETGWETGAWGYESISDFPVTDCAAFTIESRAYLTAGEDMQAKVWLAPPPPA